MLTIVAILVTLAEAGVCISADPPIAAPRRPSPTITQRRRGASRSSGCVGVLHRSLDRLEDGHGLDCVTPMSAYKVLSLSCHQSTVYCELTDIYPIALECTGSSRCPLIEQDCGLGT